MTSECSMDAKREAELKAALADVQGTADDRHIPIDRVGVRRVKYPVELALRDDRRQSTVGQFTLLVDLPQEFKGTHMSRFMEVLGEQSGPLDRRYIEDLLGKLRARLRSQCARLEVRFTLFLEKAAPITGKKGMMGYECGISASTEPDAQFELLVTCPVSTLCPCSKEISAYGAHNQRGYVTAKVEVAGAIWFEDVIEMIEESGSAPLYPVLKRPDEKYVTELAYENPRFVEDVVREVAGRFEKVDTIRAYSIEVENHESIHDHNAYASIERAKK